MGAIEATGEERGGRDTIMTVSVCFMGVLDKDAEERISPKLHS